MHNQSGMTDEELIPFYLCGNSNTMAIRFAQNLCIGCSRKIRPAVLVAGTEETVEFSAPGALDRMR